MIPLNSLGAKYVKDLAFIDFRALVFFRISIGLILICDLFVKACNLTAFYTDLGVYPIDLANLGNRWWAFSFHNFSGSFFYQASLMGLGFILSGLFLSGRWSKVVSMLTWVFMVSLHNKNPLILHAGDGLLRVLLFWWMLLTIAGFSKDKEKGVANILSAAILFQVLIMYFFTALLKSDPVWREDFLALYYALNLDQFSTGFGRWLLHFPLTLKLLSGLTYYLEILGPIIYFVPRKRALVRTALALIFMGFHLGLALTMNLGLFPWICMAAWILFLPSEFWDHCGRFLGRYNVVLVKLESTVSARSLPASASRVLHSMTVLFLATIVCWNVYTLPAFGKTPDLFRYIALPLRLDQYWSMFAPKPMTVDGWFIVDGVLRDGTSYDPWVNSNKVAWLRPSDIYKHFKWSSPWRKYISNVFINGKGDEYSRAFGRYLCREYNRLRVPHPSYEKQLVQFEISYLTEVTPGPGMEPSIDQRALWTHHCFAPKNPPKSP